MRTTAYILLALIIISCKQISDKKLSIVDYQADSLKYGDKYSVEIDFTDSRIRNYKAKDIVNSDIKLPDSFTKFIKEVANGLTIEIGNELTIFPLESNGEIWTDIKTITDEFINDSIIPDKQFVIFGMNGVDSESWGFYTGRQFKNGEYPIVWITPGVLNKDHYVLMNSRFDKFLTIQYYLLKSTDYEETMSYEEALEKSNNKEYMKKEQDKYQNMIDSLYRKYDSLIPTPKEDNYQHTMTINELNNLIDSINNAL